MNRDKLSGTLKKNNKVTTCIELMSVSKIFSFLKLMQNRTIPERTKLTLTENMALETKTCQKENSDNVAHKTTVYSLPTQIRIRATDREGNTIEVTY